MAFHPRSYQYVPSSGANSIDSAFFLSSCEDELPKPMCGHAVLSKLNLLSPTKKNFKQLERQQKYRELSSFDLAPLNTLFVSEKELLETSEETGSCDCHPASSGEGSGYFEKDIPQFDVKTAMMYNVPEDRPKPPSFDPTPKASNVNSESKHFDFADFGEDSRESETVSRGILQKSRRDPPITHLLTTNKEIVAEGNTQDYCGKPEHLSSPAHLTDKGIPRPKDPDTIDEQQEARLRKAKEIERLLLSMREKIKEQQGHLNTLAAKNAQYRDLLSASHGRFSELRKEHRENREAIVKLQFERESFESEAIFLREELNHVRQELESMKQNQNNGEKVESGNAKNLATTNSKGTTSVTRWARTNQILHNSKSSSDVAPGNTVDEPPTPTSMSSLSGSPDSDAQDQRSTSDVSFGSSPGSDIAPVEQESCAQDEKILATYPILEEEDRESEKLDSSSKPSTQTILKPQSSYGNLNQSPQQPRLSVTFDSPVVQEAVRSRRLRRREKEQKKSSNYSSPSGSSASGESTQTKSPYEKKIFFADEDEDDPQKEKTLSTSSAKESSKSSMLNKQDAPKSPKASGITQRGNASSQVPSSPGLKTCVGGRRPVLMLGSPPNSPRKKHINEDANPKYPESTLSPSDMKLFSMSPHQRYQQATKHAQKSLRSAPVITMHPGKSTTHDKGLTPRKQIETKTSPENRKTNSESGYPCMMIYEEMAAELLKNRKKQMDENEKKTECSSEAIRQYLKTKKQAESPTMTFAETNAELRWVKSQQLLLMNMQQGLDFDGSSDIVEYGVNKDDIPTLQRRAEKVRMSLLKSTLDFTSSKRLLSAECRDESSSVHRELVNGREEAEPRVESPSRRMQAFFQHREKAEMGKVPIHDKGFH